MNMGLLRRETFGHYFFQMIRHGSNCGIDRILPFKKDVDNTRSHSLST